MPTYYNENDPKAAAWLRELIRAGEIPAGEVDTRSITEVRPHDLIGFTHHHFFAGIGGWALALRLAGWPDERPVRTGSCPCQPFSCAGLGRGTRDARHLWPVWRSLLAECPPAVTFGEQVASKAGRRWLARVRSDLEALGYAVGAADLCAAGVGAPHIRQRLYWVANPAQIRCDKGAVQLPREESVARDGCSTGRMANCDGERFSGGKEPHLGAEQSGVAAPRRSDALRCGDVRGLANADGRDSGAGREPRGGQHGQQQADGVVDRMEHSARDGWEQRGAESVGGGPIGGCGTRGMGDTERDGLRVGGRSDADFAHKPGHWALFDIIHCTDGKARRIEPGSFPLAYGVPGRVGLLRGYGNAIVPQEGAEFVKAFLDIA